MPRFQLISDLHLEFYKIIPNVIPKSPYLLLAGDIGYPEQPIFTHFLKDVSKKFETVFFTPGNHEYYQNYKEKTSDYKTINELDIIMKNICNSFHNVVYLNNNSYILEDINIIGSTMWSNVKRTDNLINDYFQIYKNKNGKVENITINDILELHNNSVNYIKNEIKNSGKLNLIMTHHLPTNKLIINEYLRKYPRYTSHFFTNLENIIDPEYIATWVCGHSHAHVETEVNGVMCYLNAIGYPSENYRGSDLEFTFNL